MNQQLETLGLSVEEFIRKGYPLVPDDLKAMSKEELAIVLHGFCCQSRVISNSWKFRKRAFHPGNFDEIENSTVAELYASLCDYEIVAAINDIEASLYRRMEKEKIVGGCVYVIEFSDGHIKIGYSARPNERMQAVSSSNQSIRLRHWVSERVESPARIESAAHHNFKSSRTGGEFFLCNFDEVIAWINIEIQKRSAIDSRMN